jgi:murein DD-endopeptidase MepM/ murein hydrolase activator NlpD
MTLPLVVNRIRADGPREALGNSFGKVRNQGTKWHKGWDLSAEPNSAVYAVSDGKVVQSHSNVNGYGRCILLEIDNPRFKKNLNQSVGMENLDKLYVLYAHLSHTDISSGKVAKGDQIGKTGISGNAGGEPPHLHIEVLLANSLSRTTPRIDPGEILGYELYNCGGAAIVNQEIFGSCQPP